MKLILVIMSAFIMGSALAVDYKVISCQGDSLVINTSVGSRGGYSSQLVIGHGEINQNLLNTSISHLEYGKYTVTTSGTSNECFLEIPRKHYHGWYQKHWCYTDYRNNKNIWVGFNMENNAIFMEFYHRGTPHRSTEVYVRDCYLLNQRY